MAKWKLKFMLDYGSSCLWGDDQKTREKYGYTIDLNKVGISGENIRLSELVDEIHSSRLNPIYQLLPSFWSAEMYVFFQQKIIELFKKINKELDKDTFELNISESAKAEMEEIIDIEKINTNLIIFLSDPIKHFTQKGISFNANTLKKEINDEYQKSLKIEQKYINKKITNNTLSTK